MLLAGIGLARAQDLAPNPSLRGYDPGGGKGKKLYEVVVEGTIDLGLAAYIERVLRMAEEGDVVLLSMNTPGGRVDAAVAIKDALLKTSAVTVTWVHGEAISAGAFIALATDTIIMRPGTTLGDVMPVQQGSDGEPVASSEKIVTYMRAQMRSVAEAKGRSKELAEAMVDPDIEIKGVKPKGKLLTLTADEALRLKMCEAVVDSQHDALSLLNLHGAETVATNTLWSEKVARVLTHPMVSSLLMTFGFLGLLMELYAPGHAISGIVGVTCLALFFFGQYAASLAGWEEILLLVIGLVLLGVEVFVIPGFGVTGVLGLIAIGAALVMAFIEITIPLDVAWDLRLVQDEIGAALLRLAFAVVVLIVGGFAFARYFPTSRFGSWMVFKPAMAPSGQVLGAEAPGGQLPEGYESLLGSYGIAQTVLRPAGIALFGERRVHVVTDGEYIDRGTSVVVTEVDGARVVVRAENEQAKGA
jgi:membrane-bound serine protease (ClpP class)